MPHLGRVFPPVAELRVQLLGSVLTVALEIGRMSLGPIIV